MIPPRWLRDIVKVTGPQGPQGIQGVPGVQGPQGLTGPQGIPGLNGTNGINGTNGTDGAPGAPGAPGATGATGAGFADGNYGDITISGGVTVLSVNPGTITAAKTSITGTPTGLKYLRDDWSWQTVTAGIGGSTGSTDNLVLRADGTGGLTLQNSALRIDDVTASTQQNLALVNVDAAAKSAIVITPKGLGAVIFGNKPDGGTGGGNARGDKAFDSQLERNGATQVASGENSVVVGGARNTASAYASTCVGGYINVSSGVYSFTCGYQNQATSDQAVAMGTLARANHATSFCWGGNISYAATDRAGQFKLATDAGSSLQTAAGTRTDWGKRSSAPVTGIAEGDFYYDTTTHKMRCYNGSTWNDLF